MAAFSFVHSDTLATSSLLILCLCCCTIISLAKPQNHEGFTVEFIHRDSPKSPFFNPLETDSHRLNNALRRSVARANRFRASFSAAPNTAESPLTSASGEYLLKYSIGTPPFEILGIADTGSDLIWSQCKPCDGCYNQTAAMFDPAKSRTYRKLPCSSSQCKSVGTDASCSINDDERTCSYSVKYGDQSYTYGDVALETMTLNSTTGRPLSFPKTVIGCGHEDGGMFGPEGSGIVGLGRGAVSLISQLNSSAAGRFSYCLVPTFSGGQASSQLNFGKNAIVSGKGTVTTPMLSKSTNTFYYLILEDITVGTRRLNLNLNHSSSSSVAAEGNMIIDSGTTLTILSTDAYNKVESAVREQVKAKIVEDPSDALNLCYESRSEEFEGPMMTAHFSGGDVQLKTLNTFVRTAENVVCLAFAATDSISIFGNLAQTNFLIGYDLQKRTVSFKPTDCTGEDLL